MIALLDFASSIVLDDGTGQSVNIRIRPSTSANVVRQARSGDNLPLSSTTPVNAEGWNWWQLVSDHGGVAYVRADLVSAPHMPQVLATQPAATPSGTGDIYVDYPLNNPSDWAKRPEFYTGKRFSVNGTIFIVRESNGSTFIQMYVYGPNKAQVAVSVRYTGTSTNLQKDVHLRVGGIGAGTFSGTNSFGGGIGQPLINAVWVTNVTDAASGAEATTRALTIVNQGATATAGLKSFFATIDAKPKP